MITNGQRLIQKRFEFFWMQQKRFRYKKKWAKTENKKTAPDHALKHFDFYYKPVFDDLWPSMRCSLLSQQKYCALVNNFANADRIVSYLKSENCHNFLQSLSPINYGKIERNILAKEQVVTPKEIHEDSVIKTDGSDIHDFMPVTTVISEKERLLEEEKQQNIFEPLVSQLKTFPPSSMQVPYHLQAYTQDRGDIALFPPPDKDSTGKLGYYLMDAASILPVIALNLEPDCSVLDLCAAPGGKTLAMIQTLLPGKITCIDHSFGRIKRLKEILRLYTPASYCDDSKVEVMRGDAFQILDDHQFQSTFDRVLVDVPCFTDRHVLHEENNNIFRPGRIRDRLDIQNLQQSLLVAGIKACSPGGNIVYSTCTLSPPQNDGVINAAAEYLWQNSDIDVVVEDTTCIAQAFKETFSFFGNCRFGQLVVPNLSANFGPFYFCKLKRLR